MSLELTSVASIKRKTKESSRVDSLMPQQWLENSEKLLELLKEYYNFLGLEGQPSYEINRILDSRDVDKADEKYLNEIQKQIAGFIPKNINTASIPTLYKGITRFYKVRGSIDSIEIFFKVFLRDEVQIKYPYEQVLIPSSGEWDPNFVTPIIDENGIQIGEELGAYTSNKGFLSDKIFIQDSFFYQKFSYVIQTGSSQTLWGLPYSKLIHPAGFIFFSEIVLLIYAIGGEEAVQSVMPKIQPGLVTAEDLPFLIEIFASLFKDKDSVKTVLTARLQQLLTEDYLREVRSKEYARRLAFRDTTPMTTYDFLTFENFESRDINRPYNRNIGAIIDQTTA